MTRTSTSHLEIDVLGPIRAVAGGAELDLGGAKPRLVLALLVADGGSVVGTDRLVDALWGDEPVPSARKTLHAHLSHLRRALGERSPIVTERSGYRLDLTDVAVDAIEFERDVRRAGELPDDEAADLLASALGRWRGVAYADLRDEGAIRAEAVRLDELRLGAVEARIDADLRLGRHERLLGELEALTTEHPFRERLRCQQLLALYRSGRQAEALRAYDRARQALVDELGVDPGEELSELRRAILDHAARLDLPSADRCSTAGSAGPIAGSVRGYELRELVGRGPVAAVYRAYQASIGREVAIEVIPPDVANEPEFVRRFEAECRQLADLDHPHVVRLYDYWRDPSGGYLVMPFMRGGSLERALTAGPLTAAAGLRVVEQVGAALGHAHRRHVVHGDLRPENVLLDEEGNAYLSGFAPDGPRDLTRPERRAGRPATIATDVRAFGALACQVLTGGDVDGATASELPPGLLADLRRATDPDPDHRFDHVDDVVRACRRALSGSDAPSVERRARNPYKGLRAFGEADAGDFFGRRDLVDELVTRLGRTNLTVVVGPSGCGKSSLVRAGLIPALRRDGLPDGRPVVVAEMFPGAYPFEELEAALLHVAVDRPAGLLETVRSEGRGLAAVAARILPDDTTVLVLVVDQFEELFTTTRERAERERFLASLRDAALDEGRRVRVVATLRADFFDRPLRHADFGDLVERSTMTLAMPTETSLTEAITEPARRVGLRLQPELLPTILRDIGDEPGALPMLQYALTEMTADRDHDVLTVDVYRRIGGVVGALARRAETIYRDLSPAGQDAAREMFMRLVTVDDDAHDTRRRVRLTELRGLDVDTAGLDAALEAFGTFRLLTFDRDAATRGPTVEVAHEALIHEWPRLRDWIEERRDDLRTERRLRAEAAEWHASGREPSYLIGGVRLHRYEEWSRSADVRLSTEERSFVAAARDAEDERNRSVGRRRRFVLATVSLLAVAAVAAAAVAVVQRDRAGERAEQADRAAMAAQELRTAAERRALEEEARALLAEAADLPDPDLRLLLALDSFDALAAAGADRGAAAGALYEFTTGHDAQTRLTLDELDAEGPLDLGGTFLPTALVASDDGHVLVATPVGGSTITTFDGQTGEQIGSIRLDGSAIASTWDQARGLVLTGVADGRVVAWRPDGELAETFRTPSRLVAPIARDADTTTYADFGRHSTMITAPPFSVVIIDSTSGAELLTTPRTMESHALAPDRDRLVTVDRGGRIQVIDLRVPEVITPAAAMTADDADWAADGRTLWLLTDDRLVPVDAVTGTTGADIPTGLTNTGYLDVSPNGAMVVVGGPGTPARVLTLPDGELVAELDAGLGPSSEREAYTHHLEPMAGMSVTWLTDRRIVIEQGDPVIWDLADVRAPASVWSGIAFVPATAVLGRDGRVVIGSEHGDVVAGTDGSWLRLEGHVVDADAPAPPALGGGVAVVPGRRAVEVRDDSTGELVARGPDGFPRPLAVTPDGERMLVASSRDPEDGRFRFALADAATGATIRVVAWLADAERAVVDASGRVALVAVSERRSEGMAQPTVLWLVDMTTGHILGTGPMQDCIIDLGIEATGARAVAIGCDGSIGLYDLATIVTKRPPIEAVLFRDDVASTGTGIAISPDGRTVVATRTDGRVDGFRVVDDTLVPMWSFHVGGQVRALGVVDGSFWLGVRRPLELPGDVGGLIGLPLDLDELVAFARTLPTRALSADECATYAVGGACTVSGAR